MNTQPKSAIRKVTVLDVTWSDMSDEAKREISQYWRYLEFGNDFYVHQTSLAGLQDNHDLGMQGEVFEADETGRHKWIKRTLSLEHTLKYLRDAGLDENEEIWIHYWW